jgi:hypothetical protein
MIAKGSKKASAIHRHPTLHCRHRFSQRRNSTGPALESTTAAAARPGPKLAATDSMAATTLDVGRTAADSNQSDHDHVNVSVKKLSKAARSAIAVVSQGPLKRCAALPSIAGGSIGGAIFMVLLPR